MPPLSWRLPAAHVLAICALLVSCRTPPRARPAATVVWTIAAPVGAGFDQANVTTEQTRLSGGLLVIDSTSLRPILRSEPSLRANPAVSRIAVVTTFEGSRYHPEAIRALFEDEQVMSRAAGAIATSVPLAGNGLFLDFQNAAPDDIRGIAALMRSIADSARAARVAPVGMIVPAGDTVGYPTRILARSADLLVVRLYGEHGPGTPPGPLLSPEWIARHLGMRSREIGANRIVAELPLFGYRWDRNGRVTPITFAAAQALVLSDAGSFRRDPPSGFLTASGRDGWTLWIPDGRSIATMIGLVRRSGINRIALAGPAGADPDIWVRLPAAIR
jgi:spore germination protein YaaH